MLKKTIITVLALVALIGLNGCGSSDNGSNNNDDLITLFLVDENGLSYGNIPYHCDSMSNWETTRPNGEFTFLSYDNCEFDFIGLEGNYANDSFSDHIIRIVDFDYNGKNDIAYNCALFGAGTTYGDGRFDYDADDSCVFYL